MIKNIRMLFLAVVLTTNMSCGAVQKVIDTLPTVIQYVQDAGMILDAIDRAVLPVLAMKQDKELSQKYASAMDSARQALQVALRSAEGGKQLSEKDLDAAFANFRQAYAQLTSLLQQANLMNASGTMSAVPGMVNVTVDTPLAVSRTGH